MVLRYLEGLSEQLLRLFTKTEWGREGGSLLTNVLPLVWNMLSLGLWGDIQAETRRQQEAIWIRASDYKGEEQSLPKSEVRTEREEPGADLEESHQPMAGET